MGPMFLYGAHVEPMVLYGTHVHRRNPCSRMEPKFPSWSPNSNNGTHVPVWVPCSHIGLICFHMEPKFPSWSPNSNNGTHVLMWVPCCHIGFMFPLSHMRPMFLYGAHLVPMVSYRTHVPT